KINEKLFITNANNKFKNEIETKLINEKEIVDKLLLDKKIIEVYMTFVGSNGIPFSEAKKMCSYISDYVNEILSKFSAVTISIELNNSKVEIYRTNGIKLPSTMSSGYEQMAIDLAIKITLG